jgi:hypothetical protein
VKTPGLSNAFVGVCPEIALGPGRFGGTIAAIAVEVVERGAEGWDGNPRSGSFHGDHAARQLRFDDS